MRNNKKETVLYLCLRDKQGLFALSIMVA